jgi:hypothetical protein
VIWLTDPITKHAVPSKTRKTPSNFARAISMMKPPSIRKRDRRSKAALLGGLPGIHDGPALLSVLMPGAAALV